MFGSPELLVISSSCRFVCLPFDVCTSQAKVIQSQLGVGASSMGFDTKKVFSSEVRTRF